MLSNITSTGLTDNNLLKLENKFSGASLSKNLESNDIHKNLAFCASPQLLKAYFLPVSFGKTSQLSVEKAKAYIKKEFNIDADFGDNLKLANLVATGLKNLEKQKIPLKNSGLRIAYDYSVFEHRPKPLEKDGSPREVEPALMITGENVLYFNPKFDWNNLENRIEKNFKKGNLAYSDPVGLIYHEIGHFLHYKSNSGKYKAADQEIPSDTQKDIIQEQVSKLAVKDFGEFVAEIFAGTMLGKTYSPEIQEIYKDWAYYGPDIFN
ncbi:MAG: hypothetical protein A2104_00725 [Candidatus Melainabacteria bacterium GWF2_32_7]|nr:MAG: hypothetical protein A2104_00725 [Candidatus Melainabacteria bacterium GWF2_32_7]